MAGRIGQVGRGGPAFVAGRRVGTTTSDGVRWLVSTVWVATSA